ncbi:hypothetical protein QA601_15270 [Chitinispirillales bacterium ANBcel5]|uniref:hypothetical protein n=1 Tax=Cellulosispirillum alkaliphilum TaxID=3039283 RepID=UPI002A4F514F|nr:hypothetical protein [Chitinispirillales bacterium ANBcel5]
MSQPNLFQFATSELSQDAVLCWFLSWLVGDAGSLDPELTNIARNLVCLFFNQFDEYDPIEPSDVFEVTKLEKQYNKIDVFFLVIIKGYEVPFAFIVEDKTNTSYHSKQLERYYDFIEHKYTSVHDILGIYFKTGFINQDDERLPDKYRLIDNNKWLDFLQNQHCTNPIFAEYNAYFADYYEKFNKSVHQALSPTQFEQGLRTVQGQGSLLSKITDKLITSEHRYLHGMNIGGTPWAQYHFWASTKYCEHESFFIRIDFRKCKRINKDYQPYISFRNYSKYNRTRIDCDDRIKRLSYIRWLFQQVWEKVKVKFGHNIIKDTPVADKNSGNYEQEIAVIFLDPLSNTPEMVIPVIRELMVEYHSLLEQAYHSFKTLHQLKDEVISEITSGLGDYGVITNCSHIDKESNLLEITVSMQHWQDLFGEDGLVVMLFQHRNTPGCFINCLCRFESSPKTQGLLKQMEDIDKELKLSEVPYWKPWYTVYADNKDSERGNHFLFDAKGIAEKVVVEVKRLDEKVRKLDVSESECVGMK